MSKKINEMSDAELEKEFYRRRNAQDKMIEKKHNDQEKTNTAAAQKRVDKLEEKLANEVSDYTLYEFTVPCKKLVFAKDEKDARASISDLIYEVELDYADQNSDVRLAFKKTPYVREIAFDEVAKSDDVLLSTKFEGLWDNTVYAIWDEQDEYNIKSKFTNLDDCGMSIDVADLEKNLNKVLNLKKPKVKK